MEVHVRGIPVHYEAFGAGRTIVLLHGGGTDHRLMTHAFEPAFAGREGWLRLYPDLPGMGRTPAADWIRGEDDMLAVVEGFVDAVAGGRRIVLAGGSYGGYLALGFVHRRPADLEGLLLVAPALRTADPAPLPAHQVFERDEAVVASLQEDERGWEGRSVAQTAANLEFFRTAVMPGVRIADQAFLERLDAGPNLSIDVGKPLASPFSGPTLIIAGRQDNVVGWADTLPLLDSFPRATFAVLDRAGHGVRAEQRSLVAALVGEWLDRLEAEPPADAGFRG
jgi:pimeloyl-ACP methyl ester carboxylesterase